MKNILWDLSEQLEPEVSELYASVLGPIYERHTECLVVGATARDLMLSHYGVPLTRATKDIDFGVRVASWGDFELLRQSLIKSGDFKPGETQHRLVHCSGLPIDIIPFGSIGGEDQKIQWPQGTETMSILGYDEAYQCSQPVLITQTPRLEVRFATPVGIVTLKLIAWFDRPRERERDAADLLHLIYWYVNLGNEERLVSEHEDVINMPKFDTFKGGARLLGRDMGRAVYPQTAEALLTILERETVNPSSSLLVEQMMSSKREEFLFEDLREVLSELGQGIRESAHAGRY